MVQKSGSKSSSSGKKVTKIEVFAERESGYGDVDRTLRPSSTKLQRSKCLPSGMSVMET